MMAMEAGTFSVINTELSIPEITKLLSKGDDCCLAVIELPVSKKIAGELSPQATPRPVPTGAARPGPPGQAHGLGLPEPA